MQNVSVIPGHSFFVVHVILGVLEPHMHSMDSLGPSLALRRKTRSRNYTYTLHYVKVKQPYHCLEITFTLCIVSK